jgi:MoxR-like ATPase
LNKQSTDRTVIKEILFDLNSKVLGKERQVKLAVTSLFAQGHLLIEDIPGVGKTTLAHALAHTMGLDYNRVQFTSDLLPADILGSSIYERQKEEFTFHPGPIFTNLLLADEINRASPKCQSALLESMEEGQVSIEGTTHVLASPFFVIATQNPIDQIGTYPLPESQLDRFLMSVSLGYPGISDEKDLLHGVGLRNRVAGKTKPIINAEILLNMQKSAESIDVSTAFVDYLHAILHHSRTCGKYKIGLSPRAGISILKASKAWAFIEGRNYVRPDDLQNVLPSVINHRLCWSSQADVDEIQMAAPLLKVEIS